jgi:hypothetical protein
VFTELERKLIWLALDEAAQPGEVRNSATKFFESLRRRKLRPEVLISGRGVRSSPAEVTLRAARCMRMTFGRHRGKHLDQIPLSYLRWVVSECSNISVALREAIHIVLKEGGAL